MKSVCFNKGISYLFLSFYHWGWLGDAKVLGKLTVLGRPTTWMIVGQVSIALAVGAG